jgi:RNA polymerase sigma factor (sigma-70 family)
MRLSNRELCEISEADNRCHPKPGQLFPRQKRPHVIILLQDNSARKRRHPHANAGRTNMSSNMDTRPSVIMGVCQQDPERWREFDSIYRPILFAFLNKQGLKESQAEEVISDTYLKLLGKIQTYDRTKCRFRTWLFQVTRHTLIDYIRRRTTYQKAVEGWAANVLQTRESDSILMWRKIHREKILKHALKVVRAQVSLKAWTCFQQRMLLNRPAAEIAADLTIELNVVITRNDVYVNACRVMKLVRGVCEEFDEDISHAFDSDVSE